MYLYETHLHTYPASACATNTPEEMVRYYKQKNYAGVIITDHFFNGNSGCRKDIPWSEKVAFFIAAFLRAKNEGRKYGLDVFFGLEYSFRGTDFLVYGLDEAFLLNNPGFDNLGMVEFSAAVRGACGYLAQAHPFRDEWWIANPEPVSPSLIDGIEVYNATMSNEVNNLALQYAEKHGLAKQSGSDAHNTFAHRSSGISLQKRAANIFEIIDEIKKGRATLLR